MIEILCRENSTLPRFPQSYYSREQIFARGNHHLLANDYSQIHDILSKGHVLDLELQTTFFITDHSNLKLIIGRSCSQA